MGLQSIVMALQAYHDHHGSLPPATFTDETTGNVHSWRVLLLPYLDQPAALESYRFDEPWDSPHNIDIAEKVSLVLTCPAARSNSAPGTTSYVAVVGPGSAWDAGSVQGVLRPAQNAPMILVEVSSIQVGCFEPRDFDLGRLPKNAQTIADTMISSDHRGSGANVAFLDGEVTFLSIETSIAEFNALVEGN